MNHAQMCTHKKKWPETMDALKRSDVHNHTQNGPIYSSVIKIPQAASPGLCLENCAVMLPQISVTDRQEVLPGDWLRGEDDCQFMHFMPSCVHFLTFVTLRWAPAWHIILKQPQKIIFLWVSEVSVIRCTRRERRGFRWKDFDFWFVFCFFESFSFLFFFVFPLLFVSNAS